MKLLAVAVFYYPDRKAYDNLSCYIRQVDGLLIWDNTPEIGHSAKVMEELSQIYTSECLNKIKVSGLEENKGLSFAYNKGIEYARKNRYSHLMTMDQDSEWCDFAKFKDFADIYFDRCGDAVLGPVINENCEIEEIRNVASLINSGAIYPLKVIEKIGGYCERFLVDAVDVEFCYRAHRHKIPVLVIGGHGGLIQEFGKCKYFKFRGRNWYCTNYSPFRLYGIARNHMLVARLYPEQEDNKYRLKNVYIKQYTIAILLKEKNKIKKLLALYNGLISGLLTYKSINQKYSKA